MPECSVITKTWPQMTADDVFGWAKLRTDIFFLEQHIDEEELDDRDRDPTTEHLWIEDAAGTAAYLRVILDDKPSHLDARRLFGRVVTRADRRGEGLSQRLIAEVIARHGHKAMLLHAQEYIAPLYAKFGFTAFGDRYLEAGIPHISMYRAGLDREYLR